MYYLLFTIEYLRVTIYEFTIYCLLFAIHHLLPTTYDYDLRFTIYYLPPAIYYFLFAMKAHTLAALRACLF